MASWPLTNHGKPPRPPLQKWGIIHLPLEKPACRQAGEAGKDLRKYFLMYVILIIDFGR